MFFFYYFFFNAISTVVLSSSSPAALPAAASPILCALQYCCQLYIVWMHTSLCFVRCPLSAAFVDPYAGVLYHRSKRLHRHAVDLPLN